MKRIIIGLSLISALVTSSSAVEYDYLKLKTKDSKEQKEDKRKTKLDNQTLILQEIFNPTQIRKTDTYEKKFILEQSLYKYQILINTIQFNAPQNLYTITETHITDYTKEQTKDFIENNKSICDYSYIKKIAKDNDKNEYFDLKVKYKIYYMNNKDESNKIFDKTVRLSECL